LVFCKGEKGGGAVDVQHRKEGGLRSFFKSREASFRGGEREPRRSGTEEEKIVAPRLYDPPAAEEEKKKKGNASRQGDEEEKETVGCRLGPSGREPLASLDEKRDNTAFPPTRKKGITEVLEQQNLSVYYFSEGEGRKPGKKERIGVLPAATGSKGSHHSCHRAGAKREKEGKLTCHNAK